MSDENFVAQAPYPGTKRNFDDFMRSLMSQHRAGNPPPNAFVQVYGEWESANGDLVRFGQTTHGPPVSEMLRGNYRTAVEGVWWVWTANPDGAHDMSRMASIRAYHVAERQTVVSFRDGESRVAGSRVGSIGLAFQEFAQYIVKRITELAQQRERTEGSANSLPVETDSGEKRGPTEVTRLRAQEFKRLKDAHPEWSQGRVAIEACETLGVDNLTADSVRNAYRAMGWEWERADRVR